MNALSGEQIVNTHATPYDVGRMTFDLMMQDLGHDNGQDEVRKGTTAPYCYPSHRSTRQVSMELLGRGEFAPVPPDDAVPNCSSWKLFLMG